MDNVREIEGKVAELGDLIERQVDLAANPQVSLIRAAFQGLYYAVRAQKLHQQIFADLGVDKAVEPHSLEPFKALVSLMEERGSPAAEEIKALLPDLAVMIDAVEKAGAGGNPLRVVRAVRSALNK